MPSNSKNISSFQNFTQSLAELCNRREITAWPKLLLLSGASEYLVYKSSQAIKQSWIKHINQPFTTVDATDLDLNEFEKISSQPAMFDPISFYLVRRIDQKKDFLEIISTLQSANCLSNHICFTQVGRQSEKLKKLIRNLKIETITCYSPRSSEVGSYIQKVGRKHKLQFSWDAVQFLVNAIGDDLSALENEVSKLAMIYQDKEQIEIGDIRSLIDYQREDLAFNLRTHIMKGQFGRAHLLLTELLRRGESALGVLGLIARHCRLAIQIKQLHQQGTIPKVICQKTGLQNFQVNQYTRYSISRSERKFIRALSLCAFADLKIKSTKFDQELLLGQIIEALR